MILFVNGEPRLFQDPGETGDTHRLSDDDRDFLVKWMCHRLFEKAPAAFAEIGVMASNDRIKFTFDFGFGEIGKPNSEGVSWQR